MFRALICPSPGARDYDVDYHIGHFVLSLMYVGSEVRLGWSSVGAAARTLLQPNRTSPPTYIKPRTKRPIW